MNNRFWEGITELLINSGNAGVNEIKGCSIKDILFIENKLEIKLPKIYKEFLLNWGLSAGSFFQGTDIFFSEEIIQYREVFERVIVENGNKIKLPSNIFVFSSHQGYQFNYFYLNDGDDPPVYFYVGAPEEYLERKWATFSEFLFENLVEHIMTFEYIKLMDEIGNTVRQERKTGKLKSLINNLL